MQLIGLLTCFNRCELTLECLTRFFAQELPVGVELSAVLVDDGSHDGTAEAVRERFPEVTLLGGDGGLYWCGGMRKAWEEAEKTDPEFLLALNDDTFLFPGAIKALLEVANGPEVETIAVGAVGNPDDGELVYGGRLRSRPAGPPALDGEPTECDTFNGNCVLIPRAVRQKLGMFHGAYTHSFADFDYGIRARRIGIRVVQTPGVVGHCRPNSADDTWKNARLSRGERFRRLQSPKGMPWRDHLAFARRTQGAKWPRHLLAPYLRILLGK